MANSVINQIKDSMTQKQNERVSYVLNCGPVMKREGDDELIQKGLIEQFDGQDDTVDGTDYAKRTWFNSR